MTDPLIDRDFLAEVIENSVDPRGIDWNEVAADEVMAYLRSVLTPEALATHRTFLDADGETVSSPFASLTGAEMHRRIFGASERNA